MKRFLPERSFPSYAFTPGKNTHPNKEGGHFYGEPELISSNLTKENPDYLFSIDLINNQYYWEAHVYLEAIWNAHNRKGPEADFCKGLIKMSAAALKYRLGSREAFFGHIDRAIELFNPLISENLDLRISPKDLISICEKWKEEDFVELELYEF